jgi:hypothetical protein
MKSGQGEGQNSDGSGREATAAAGESRGVRVGTARRQPDPPPFYTWPSLRPDYSASGRIIRAPRIFRPGGRYSGLGSQKLNNSKFSKIDVVLMKNLNSCAKIRYLETGWLR